MSSAKLTYRDPYAMFIPKSHTQPSCIEIRDLTGLTGLNVTFPLNQCITFKKYFQAGVKDLNMYNFYPITVKVIGYESSPTDDGRSKLPQDITKLYYRHDKVDSFISLTFATYNDFERKGEIPEWTTIRVADCESTPTVTLSDDAKHLDITINEQHVLLTVGDCIQYAIVFNKPSNVIITKFDVTNTDGVRVVTRIRYRPNESYNVPDEFNKFHIGLTDLHFKLEEKQSGNYEWTSIVKIGKPVNFICPRPKRGGRRINRRTTKKARKNIRRYSRRT